jgi:hypothetical protein
VIKGNWNKKYTKKKSSSQIIDEKIVFLDREMKKTTLGEAIANSTSGLYTVTGFGPGDPAIPEIPAVPAVPPTYDNVTGGISNPDDFSWPDQGDGSDPDAATNIPSNLYTTYNGEQVPALRAIDTYNGQQVDYGDYPSLGGLAFRGGWLGWAYLGYLSGSGIRGAGTTNFPDGDIGNAIYAAYNNWPFPGTVSKTIYQWSQLDCLFGSCKGASQYYPAGLSATSTPKAERALYAWTVLLPADADDNLLSNRIMTDPGSPEIPSVPGIPEGPPKHVVLSRNGLGDPNFFAGFIDSLNKGVESISDAISSTIEDIIQVVEPIIDALGSTSTFLLDSLQDFTFGINDGLNLLNDVRQTINSAYQNGDVIPPVNPNERPTIAEGALGSQSNPIQNNLSSNTVNYFSNSLNNYDASVDTDLRNYINTTITTVSPIDQGGNFGAKGTHNTVTGEPYVDSSGNVHIPDTYGFGPSEDIANKPIVQLVSSFASDLVGSLYDNATGSQQEEKNKAQNEVRENIQTFFDQSGFGFIPGTPGKDSPIVHFETVIPASKIPNANFNTSTVKESNLFEKFKRKSLQEPKKNGMQALVKTLESLPKSIKKVLLFQIMTELEIAFLSPDQKAYKEKEIRNKLLVKTSELYVDTHFPENQKLFKKLQQSIKKNIKLTDPKTFKNVTDTPSFKKLLSVDYVNKVDVPKKKPKLQNRNKKTTARFLKKPKIKSAMELINIKIIELDREMKKTGIST